MRMSSSLRLLAGAVCAAWAFQAEAADMCEQLTHTQLKGGEIETATSVKAGRFVPPYGEALDGLPGFCRVAGILRSSDDSTISFEVWMPSSGWNGKFLGVGNGGFAGSIGFNMMAANLKRGYATAATDTGHAGESLDASWAFEHPEKVVDFGYRALHETTVAAKSLVAAFYARPAAKAYFDSCSNGGREALMEAQRFPEDYDGILAGAPANNWTHLLSAGIQTAQALYGNPSSYIPPVKLKAIEDLANKACDAIDGIQDGIISDPERCTINTSTLLCKGRENRSCLTENQANALKHFYAGAHDSKGQLIFPGYVPGSEGGGGGWKPWILGKLRA